MADHLLTISGTAVSQDNLVVALGDTITFVNSNLYAVYLQFDNFFLGLTVPAAATPPPTPPVFTALSGRGTSVRYNVSTVPAAPLPVATAVNRIHVGSGVGE